MANSTVNKVVLGNETLIDLTPVTVTVNKLASGYTALDASGALITGALDPNQGSAYQDADGYVVLDEGESTAPQGTLAITADGSYNVADYAGATVDVVKTYTATISGNGSSNYCYAQVNGTGTKYYTDGDTFTFGDGDDIYLAYRGCSDGTTVTLNGDLIKKENKGTSNFNYTVKNPRCGITIEFTFSVAQTYNVNFVVSSTAIVTIEGGGLRSVGGAAFADVDGLSSTDLKNFISRSSLFKDITWPSGITSIGSYAFAGFPYFNPASLPDTVTSISNYAFLNCTGLTSPSMPSGLKSIGMHAFDGCTSLALTSLPSGASMNNYAFYGCTSLALTSLPSAGSSVAPYVFYGCTSLALTSLPSSKTNIGTYAFYNCESLALTSLPSGITVIGAYAFYNCKQITVSELPIGVTTLNTYAFAGCTSITSISSDAAITTIGSYFMTGTSANPTMSLRSASFPNMTTSCYIQSTAFGATTAERACQLLEFADIGSSKSISASAFANCYALQTLVMRRSDAICALSNANAFYNTPMNGYNNLTGTVYVPSALISTYQTATNWKTLYDAGTVTFAAIEGSEYELE